ncbi:MAG: nuclear transport factor 2 family protein [Pseudomonadota bacterium]|nr:nuclear transport factor 2 family protein [Pseudomonadota bacterium]
MQMLATTRLLSEVDRDLIADVLKSLFARRKAGDVDGMMNLMAADVVCFPNTSWGHARYPRKIVGKEAVREAFWQRHINYVSLESKVHRLLIDGDSAAIHRTTKICERGGGDPLSFDVIDFFRFRDGLIVEMCELPDGTAYDAVINFPH